jgi:pimeloyl-ACP methyl ester carboxylesterase
MYIEFNCQPQSPMRRRTIRVVVGLCSLIAVAALTGATYQWLATRKDLAATPPPGHLVDIGGHRLHLWCTGDGAPAVILDTGLGGSSAGWGFVQPEVARFTRVCSYDRAGMGYSDPGPSPRTARRIASELAELLARSGIAGPVVLVGASIAGFDVRVFASDYSERAAGLVLVDASHEDDAHEVPRMARFVPLLSTIGLLRLFGVSFGEGPESLAPSVRQFAQATQFRAAGHQAAADEIIHIRESAEEVRSSRRKLTIPVLVVTGARGADENWRRLQRDQASLSERGCLIIAQQSGHVVSADQPEVVVDAIRTVVETARGHDVPLCPTPADPPRQ